MPLADHLRELRSRLSRGLLAIAIGTVAAWFFYDQIFSAITEPFTRVVAQTHSDGRNVQLALTGVADPFTLRLQVTAVAGIVLTAPVWLWQIWRFVTPGLHRHERRWSLLFVALATPLFLSGTVLAYYFLPQALGFLLDFTPANVSNIVDVTGYVSFFLRTVLVFGIGFLLPLFALMLNLAGILPARALLRAWRWIVLGVFLFSAVATPDGNPFTMAALAVPILALIAVVTGVAVLHDRGRRDDLTDLADLADDEARCLDEPDTADR